MNFRSILTSFFFIRSILVISLFLLIFISSVSYKHEDALIESTELLVHSYKIQNRLAQVLALAEDAETGQRGYIISNDSVFLEPYIMAKPRIDKVFDELKSLTANNIQQYYNLDSLKKLTDRRFILLDISLVLIASHKDRSVLDANMVRGKNTMDLIRNQIAMMNDLERKYFEEHRKKYSHELYFTPLSTLFLMLFSLLIFILSFIKINRDLIIQKKNYDALRLSAESFQHAEEIGNFSNWAWYMDTNTIVFSDNHYKLLGVEPQSFEPTVTNFLKYVHPADREIVEASIRLAMTERKPFDIAFRIVKKNKEIRYFRSVAKLTDIRDKPILIGINTDVTDQHLSSIAIEERNRELEQSNAELASFNHIASHDLQEPLRKIQTFISRILEKDEETLTETSKEYFSRIQNSLKRMRSLINDLLLFSSVTKTDKIFKKTDLNASLDNAIQELISDIENKGAEIKSVTLPILNVIPFQMQQLFQNLIGNSLKYGKSGVSPLINIDYEMVNEPDNSHPEETKYRKYHRISITDNGIGFEPEYAENIFILFYRLHPRTESPGSGIGLSICKKIVENHNGYIKAFSKSGIGATFSFFLPVNDTSG